METLGNSEPGDPDGQPVHSPGTVRILFRPRGQKVLPLLRGLEPGALA